MTGQGPGHVQTVLVLNSKGGCGKSTIATNLASYYAANGVRCMLMDYDPQGSSLQWLKLRSSRHPPIHGINASKTRPGLTRTWQMAVPAGTGRVVIDSPAGVEGLMLQEMLRRSNVVLVPVTPSPIDIHATSSFIQDLLTGGAAIRHHVFVGVVANRVKGSTAQFDPLKKFLARLRIPFVASLSDSEAYIQAAEEGIGIHEMDDPDTGLERGQWTPLIQWLADPTREVTYAEVRPRLNVVIGQAAKG
jgi:chromosome partitioning protein